MKSFITGSYAYGKPNIDSDIDIVVNVSPEDKVKLENRLYFPKSLNPGLSVKSPDQKVNLILTTTVDEYTFWKTGTDILKNMANEYGPLDKEVAIQVFDTLRGVIKTKTISGDS